MSRLNTTGTYRYPGSTLALETHQRAMDKFVPQIWEVFCVLRGCSHKCFIASCKANPLCLHNNLIIHSVLLVKLLHILLSLLFS